MNAKETLERIENLLKSARGQVEKMNPDRFAEYAVEQVEKAVGEEPKAALPRIEALKSQIRTALEKFEAMDQELPVAIFADSPAADAASEALGEIRTTLDGLRDMLAGKTVDEPEANESADGDADVAGEGDEAEGDEASTDDDADAGSGDANSSEEATGDASAAEEGDGASQGDEGADQAGNGAADGEAGAADGGAEGTAKREFVWPDDANSKSFLTQGNEAAG